VATVNLTGITAGTLRFDTTNVLVNGGLTEVTGGPFSGEYRITEEPTSGGTVTTLLSGVWSAVGTIIIPGEPIEPATISFPSSDLIAPRPTIVNTGNVTYRLQVRRSSGSAVLTGALAILRAAKAS
jgi:hypothetical protein